MDSTLNWTYFSEILILFTYFLVSISWNYKLGICTLLKLSSYQSCFCQQTHLESSPSCSSMELHQFDSNWPVALQAGKNAHLFLSFRILPLKILFFSCVSRPPKIQGEESHMCYFDLQCLLIRWSRIIGFTCCAENLWLYLLSCIQCLKEFYERTDSKSTFDLSRWCIVRLFVDSHTIVGEVEFLW